MGRKAQKEDHHKINMYLTLHIKLLTQLAQVVPAQTMPSMLLTAPPTKLGKETQMITATIPKASLYSMALSLQPKTLESSVVTSRKRLLRNPIKLPIEEIFHSSGLQDLQRTTWIKLKT